MTFMFAYLIALAFLAAPLVFFGARFAHPRYLALLPLLLFGGFLSYGPELLQGQVIVANWTWVQALGIHLSFQLDALALVFALLITGIGSCIYLYASAYLPNDDRSPRFFTALTVFMASMLGAVLANDLISLIVFWELTSLSSFILIAYDPERASSRRSAQQGLLITVAGGLCLLAGAILLGHEAGTYEIKQIIAHYRLNDQSTLSTVVLWLLVLGAFTKSAQSPFHSWLPNAMVAPTPVSAYLHSATMVKLGVYLLARLYPSLAVHDWWTPLVMGAGLLTMLTASVLALRETDLKRVLAYSTLVSLGTLFLLLGTTHPLAMVAMVCFLVVHALYKASLFMVAGIVDHQVGTRELPRLAGLSRHMPLTALIAVLGALSMAGIPPLLGFVAKELVYEAGLAAGMSWWVWGVLIGANACMVMIAALIAWRVFFSRPVSIAPVLATDPSPGMYLGPLLLAALGLFLGIFPSSLNTVLSAMVSAIQGQPSNVQLQLWHGFTPMLYLSILTLLLGYVLCRYWPSIQRVTSAWSWLERYGPDRFYDLCLHALQVVARWQTDRIQTGSLRHYMAMSMSLVAGTVLMALFMQQGLAWPDWSWETLSVEALLPLLLALAAVAVVLARSFVKGLVAAGMVGFGVAVVFVFGGAPDLAFTQFSVEALAIVILLAVIGHMPFRQGDARRPAQAARDAVIAALFGVMFVVLLGAILALPFNAALSDFFRIAAYEQAFGRNLVNVIIVDFRALDTLGEITVLALAALAAYAVFHNGRQATHPSDSPKEQR